MLKVQLIGFISKDVMTTNRNRYERDNKHSNKTDRSQQRTD